MERTQKRQNWSVPGPLDTACTANRLESLAAVARSGLLASQIHGVQVLGERDAYVVSHGSRALGVAIFNTDLRSDAIGLLDISIREEEQLASVPPRLRIFPLMPIGRRI